MQNAFTIELALESRRAEWQREIDAEARLALAQPVRWWQRLWPYTRLVLSRFHQQRDLTELKGEQIRQPSSSPSPSAI